MTDATPDVFADLRDIGGCLCLDLTNTVEERVADGYVDRLASYGDFLAWAECFEILSAAKHEAFQRAAHARPEEAAQALKQIRCAREAIYRVCSGLATGASAPEPSQLRVLNVMAPRLLGHTALSGTGDRTISWRLTDDDLLGPLCPVLWSLIDLLRGPELPRLRQCASGSCHWLFIDRSRNRSRRWCAMWNCGNREKGRRFYHAHKD